MGRRVSNMDPKVKILMGPKVKILMGPQVKILMGPKVKILVGPKVKILMGQMANTLGSGPWAYVFAASAASAAKCFHTEVWARGPNPPGPWAPLGGSILLLKLLKQQKHKQMHTKSLSLSARSRRSESTQ